MGGAIPVYNEKNILIMKLELWKVGKMQSYFPKGQFFSIPKYWQVSKYTAMLSEFSFPKKGIELNLSFGW